MWNIGLLELNLLLHKHMPSRRSTKMVRTLSKYPQSMQHNLQSAGNDLLRSKLLPIVPCGPSKSNQYFLHRKKDNLSLAFMSTYVTQNTVGPEAHPSVSVRASSQQVIAMCPVSNASPRKRRRLVGRVCSDQSSLCQMLHPVRHCRFCGRRRCRDRRRVSVILRNRQAGESLDYRR